MGTSRSAPAACRFGRFGYDFARRQLTRDGIEVVVSAKQAHVLAILLQQQESVVYAPDVQSVWPKQHNKSNLEQSLKTAICELRKVLGDDDDNPLYIQTVSKDRESTAGQLGYKFKHAIEWLAPEQATVIRTAEPPPSRVPICAVPQEGQRASRIPRFVPWGAALLVLTALVVNIAPRRWRPAAAALSRLPAAVQVTSFLGYTARPALSPDGTLLAFISDYEQLGGIPQLYLYHVRGQQLLDGRRLTTNAVELRYAAISPDNTTVAFSGVLNRQQGVYEVGVVGGEARLVRANAHAPQYSPDGKWLAYLVSRFGAATGKLVVSQREGTSTLPVPDIYDVQAAIWSPDSKYLLIQGMLAPPTGFANTIRPEWWILPLQSTVPTPLGAVAMEEHMRFSPTDPSTQVAAWLPDDHVAFSTHQGSSTNIWWVRLNRSPWGLQGNPEPLTTQSGVATMPTIARREMIYVTAQRSINLYRLNVQDTAARVIGWPERLSNDTVTELQFSLSADGAWLAYCSPKNGNYDVYLRNLGAGESERQLTRTPQPEYHVIITRDGARLAFQTGTDQQRAVRVINADGTGEREVCGNCGRPRSWSPDATKILLWRDLPPADTIGLLDVGNGQVNDIIKEPHLSVGAPLFSPDGRWIVFGVVPGARAGSFYGTFAGSIQTLIYVAPFRGMAPIARKDWSPITPEDRVISSNAFWSPDGNTIYYFTPSAQHDVLWAQGLDALKRPVGTPRPVYDIPSPFQLFHTVLGNTITATAHSIVLGLEDARTANLQRLELQQAIAH
jgi:Tol biopolymer transport system component/DNA-binding winged helix-turn-helix (wHTH) protein